ncbi:MAG: MerR family transcriptional regulator, partial [Persicimonas sp.]
MSGDSPDRATLSIGAVSKATGIPRETIRTWERRYGFPDPERNSAGHRVYPMQTVHQLRLISEALDAGHRPSNVVGEDIGKLRELLATSQAGRQVQAPKSAAQPTISEQIPADDQEWIDTWLDAAARFDGDALETHLYRAWNRLGGVRFLEGRVGPFLTALGEAWASGRLNVSHEHFTSERLRDFLTRQWRPLSDRA